MARSSTLAGDPPEKACKRCGSVLPNDAEHFNHARSVHGPSTANVCRRCTTDKREAAYRERLALERRYQIAKRSGRV